MTSKAGTQKITQRQHSQEFWDKALALAEKIRVSKAVKELGLHSSQLYGWRSKARAKRDQSDLEQSQAAEIARLKRQLAEQAEELASVKKAATYFAKSLNCYDNACAESFFHSLKVEAIHGDRFASKEEMRQTAFEYIEVDYNRTRRHSANGIISP